MFIFKKGGGSFEQFIQDRTGTPNKRQLYRFLFWSGRRSEKAPKAKGRRRSGDKANRV